MGVGATPPRDCGRPHRARGATACRTRGTVNRSRGGDAGRSGRHHGARHHGAVHRDPPCGARAARGTPADAAPDVTGGGVAGAGRPLDLRKQDGPPLPLRARRAPPGAHLAPSPRIPTVPDTLPAVPAPTAFIHRLGDRPAYNRALISSTPDLPARQVAPCPSRRFAPPASRVGDSTRPPCSARGPAPGGRVESRPPVLSGYDEECSGATGHAP